MVSRSALLHGIARFLQSTSGRRRECCCGRWFRSLCTKRESKKKSITYVRVSWCYKISRWPGVGSEPRDQVSDEETREIIGRITSGPPLYRLLLLLPVGTQTAQEKYRERDSAGKTSGNFKRSNSW